jgi:hypothetical protein
MFITTDFSLAAFLTTTKKLKFAKIIPHGTAPAEICFDDPDNIGQQIETDFINGDALVSAPEYHANLRALRQRIQVAMAQQNPGYKGGNRG